MRWCLVFALSLLWSCSVPSLEPADCAAASEVARQYYALAVGGDLANNPAALERIKSLRSPNFTAGAFVARTDRNWFNFSVIPPTSFRVGNCHLLPDGSAVAEVTVIWRLDNENYQRQDTVTAAKVDEKWLIDRIDVGKQPGPNF